MRLTATENTGRGWLERERERDGDLISMSAALPSIDSLVALMMKVNVRPRPEHLLFTALAKWEPLVSPTTNQSAANAISTS